MELTKHEIISFRTIALFVVVKNVLMTLTCFMMYCLGNISWSIFIILSVDYLYPSYICISRYLLRTKHMKSFNPFHTTDLFLVVRNALMTLTCLMMYCLGNIYWSIFIILSVDYLYLSYICISWYLQINTVKESKIIFITYNFTMNNKQWAIA